MRQPTQARVNILNHKASTQITATRSLDDMFNQQGPVEPERSSSIDRKLPVGSQWPRGCWRQRRVFLGDSRPFQITPVDFAVVLMVMLC